MSLKTFIAQGIFYRTRNLFGKHETKSHGGWVSAIAGAYAVSADKTDLQRDDHKTQALGLVAGKLNVLNLSYSVGVQNGAYNVNANFFNALDGSIVQHAKNNRAVVVKAAGNDDGEVVGGKRASGTFDALSKALIGAPSAVFVGALDKNGGTESSGPERQAVRARYSNIPGDDPAVQAQFIMAGVSTYIHRLSGTSYAAPVITGYAAVLGSKFTSATPKAIVGRLLETATTDTIKNYNRREHGVGEANIWRAIAPASLN